MVSFKYIKNVKTSIKRDNNNFPESDFVWQQPEFTLTHLSDIGTVVSKAKKQMW